MGSKDQGGFKTIARMCNTSRTLHELTDCLSRASFGGARHRLDETDVVKCVVKSGCAVSARMQVADKMSVDLSDVDRRAHEPTGNASLLGCPRMGCLMSA